MILARFRKDPAKDAALALYFAGVDAARKPRFYLDYGVADSFEGRFELLCLHMFLILKRLKAEEKGRLAGALIDHVFSGLDDALRAQGVGDLHVGKRVRALAEAFYGRCAAYEKALAADAAADALAAAVARNVYASESAERGARLADYVRAAHHELARQSLTRGAVEFPEGR